MHSTSRLRPQIDFINLQDGLQSQIECFHVNMKDSSEKVLDFRLKQLATEPKHAKMEIKARPAYKYLFAGPQIRPLAKGN